MNSFDLLDSLYKLDPNAYISNKNRQIEYKNEDSQHFERPNSGKNKPENVRIKSARIKSANRSRAKNSNNLLTNSQVTADAHPLVYLIFFLFIFNCDY